MSNSILRCHPGDELTAVRFIPDIRSVATNAIGKFGTHNNRWIRSRPFRPVFDVIPAKAGTYAHHPTHNGSWVPAGAGMTVCGVGSELNFADRAMLCFAEVKSEPDSSATGVG
jgi:hypothetical protein